MTFEQYQTHLRKRNSRGGVEDTRLEAKDTKKIQGQGQPFRGQTLSRPRTKDTSASALQKKKKKKKKVFTKIFQAIPTKKRFPKIFSSAPQNFNNSKNSAVLEPRTGQFSRTWGLEAKDLTFEAKDFKMCPRGLHLCEIVKSFESGFLVCAYSKKYPLLYFADHSNYLPEKMSYNPTNMLWLFWKFC